MSGHLEKPSVGSYNHQAAPEKSAQDKYYEYMLRIEKAKHAGLEATDTKALTAPGIADQIQTGILAKLYQMSDLSPQLNWVLSMCKCSTREQAAEKLAEQVISKQLTENLTAAIVGELELTPLGGAKKKGVAEILKEAGTKQLEVNAFGK